MTARIDCDELHKNPSQPLQSPTATKFQVSDKNLALSQEEGFMADDMEKKGQQGGQSGPGTHSGQSEQPGQGQKTGQPGQYQPKKSGQGQNETDEDDQDRDRQRRAS
ncbi:MAG: hypothetical protein WCA20_35370 [Candidatus Sulfotelmatobacter sp.]